MGPDEFSVELSWEELRALICAQGFTIEREEWLPPMTYAANTRSMLKMAYECVHTVCRKAHAAPDGAQAGASRPHGAQCHGGEV